MKPTVTACTAQPLRSLAAPVVLASSVAPPVRADPRAAISTAVVGVLRKHTGRGPTKARTTITDDVIIVTLRDCLTTAEINLASNGHTSVVHAIRRALQSTMRVELIAVVERLTGRGVEACLNDNMQHPDLAVEIFLMHPIDKAVTHTALAHDAAAEPVPRTRPF